MINKSAIDKMLAMPDDKLLSMLKIVMTGLGVDLSGRKFDEKSIRRIRAVLKEITDEDIGRIMKLAECYRMGG